jgi:predicted phosphodiesterase/DNA-directed RNA polymerase subunit RPC12/RpoP
MSKFKECPKCKANNWIKKGYDQNKKQRYKCKSCGHRTVNPDKGVPTIKGVTATVHHDFERDILPYLKKIGKRAAEKNNIERNQTIQMPSGPFAISMMSDIHGGAKSDYDAIERDIKTVRDTEDMFCVLAGDLTDNFIIGKLANLQKFQSTTFDDEIRFIEWFINTLKSSLIAFVSGNHDNWTKKLSAVDHLKTLMDGVPCLFDNNQVRFRLEQNGETEQWLVRHKFKYSSIFNPTHGMQVTWERGEQPYDVVLGGHTHIASLCNEFIKHDKKRFAVLLGTYKLRDEYGVELGYAHTHSDTAGSGCFVYDGHGEKIWCDTIQKAVKLLDYYKSVY